MWNRPRHTRFTMIQDFVRGLARGILGVQEYQEAFRSKSQRSETWPWRFWGRSGLALAAVVFFVYQQLGYDVHISLISSEVVAYAVLLIGLLLAAGPLCYLTVRFFFWFFITETYKRDLERRKWPDPWKSIFVLMSEAVLIILSVLGFLSHPWYLVLLVFFWSIPVAVFYLVLPSFVIWGLGHRTFLTLAQFDDRLERPEEHRRNYKN
jgi:hypothetical protein